MHSRVRRRTQHCVRVIAHNGVLNTSRAASVAGLPTTVTGAGYTANMTSERTWDEITDLNPGRMRDQDDATASVALGFDFIYFGRYQNGSPLVPTAGSALVTTMSTAIPFRQLGVQAAIGLISWHHCSPTSTVMASTGSGSRHPLSGS